MPTVASQPSTNLDNPGYAGDNGFNGSSLPIRTGPLPSAPDNEDVYDYIADSEYQQLSNATSANAVHNPGYQRDQPAGKPNPNSNGNARPSTDYAEAYVDVNTPKRDPTYKNVQKDTYEDLTNFGSNGLNGVQGIYPNSPASEHPYLSIAGDSVANDYLQPLSS